MRKKHISFHPSVHYGGVIEHFLAILKNGHVAADQVYFYEFNSKESANFAAHAQQSFLFQKITGTYKMNTYFLNSFNIKEQLP